MAVEPSELGLPSAGAPLAAIDVGTNSVLLTIAAGDPLEPLVERATITRLGQGVDHEGRLSPAAIARTLACLDEYRQLLRLHRVERLRVVCTSAVRDADNGAELLDAADRRLGVRPEIITGDEEARLTFLGAPSGLSISGELLVVDVGGGSTEVISGRRGAAPSEAVSLQIGSVRLTERFLVADPPAAGAIEKIRQSVRDALAPVAHPGAGAAVIGVAGTVTTLAAVAEGLTAYDSRRVHGRVLERATVEELAARLSRLPLAERRQVPGLEPARADVIVAGAWLVVEVLAWTGRDHLLVSDRGVRWGVLEEMQKQPFQAAGPPHRG